VKILVNSLPEKPADCPFAITSRHNQCLSNCSLKCNLRADHDGHTHFTNSPNGITCDLHANKKCRHLQVLYSSASW
jgi:hypothetical protein